MHIVIILLYALCFLHKRANCQVVATHMYQGEDEDELTFEKGAIIYVVPYDDAEDEVS